MSVNKWFKISAIIFGASVTILILFLWSVVDVPIDWLNDPIYRANYLVVVSLVKGLNAISGFDLLVTLLSLFSTMITGIIKVARGQ